MSNLLFAQDNLIQQLNSDELRFVAYSDTLHNSLSGGFNQPRIAMLDITNDKLPELFVLNFYSPTEQLKIYLNNGGGKFSFINSLNSNSNDSLNFIYNNLKAFYKLKARSWIRFADINSDGASDFFTSGELSEIIFYKNNGTQQIPMFSDVPDTLKSGDLSILLQQITIPNFCDIDNDQDLDLFIGNLDGTISFYKNIGTKNNYKFQFITPKFADIYVVSNLTKDLKHGNSTLDGRHGSSCIEFTDVDNDGDNDIFFSDFFLSNILFFENRGNAQNAQFNASMPDTGRFINFNSYTQILNFDIDNDSLKDIITSSLVGSKQEDEIIFYKNIGTKSNPVFNRQKQDFLFNFLNEFDIGNLSSVAILKDLENDFIIISNALGQLWMFKYIILNNNSNTIILKYIKVITPTEPLFYAACTASDVDNDGIAEILIGNSEGTLKIYNYKNGSLFPKYINGIDTIKVNQNSNPFFVDFDNDNDMDLFLGAGNGKTIYFENVGNSNQPNFKRTLSHTPLDTLDIGYDAVPRICDLDNNGDLDIMIGGRGNLNKNDEIRVLIKTNKNFEISSKYKFNPDFHNPSPLLINGSNLLLCGNYSGGLLGYKLMAKNSVFDFKFQLDKLSLW